MSVRLPALSVRHYCWERTTLSIYKNVHGKKNLFSSEIVLSTYYSFLIMERPYNCQPRPLDSKSNSRRGDVAFFSGNYTVESGK